MYIENVIWKGLMSRSLYHETPKPQKHLNFYREFFIISPIFTLKNWVSFFNHLSEISVKKRGVRASPLAQLLLRPWIVCWKRFPPRIICRLIARQVFQTVDPHPTQQQFVLWRDWDTGQICLTQQGQCAEDSAVAFFCDVKIPEK